MLIRTVRRGARSDSAYTAYGPGGEYLAIGETPVAAVGAAVDRGHDWTPGLSEIIHEPRSRPPKVGPDKIA